MEFFQTPMGKKFYDGTMPRIAEALTKIAERLAPLECTCAQTDGQRCPIPLHQPAEPAKSEATSAAMSTLFLGRIDGFLRQEPSRRAILPLLKVLANAEEGECYCQTHRSDCPGGDCDGCQDCPTGHARSILVALGLD